MLAVIVSPSIFGKNVNLTFPPPITPPVITNIETAIAKVRYRQFNAVRTTGT